MAAGREDVHVATGMLAVQLRVEMHAAFDRLRAHAISQDLPLAAVARAVLEHRLILPDDRDA